MSKEKDFEVRLGDSMFKIFPMDHRPVFGVLMMQETLRYFCGMSLELKEAKELHEKLGAWISGYEAVRE